MRYSDKSVFEVATRGPLGLGPERAIELLTPYVTRARGARIAEVVAGRSLDVAPLLENVADPHNASAVLRSCDAFGIARAHVIADRNAFLASRKVSKGTEKWVDVRKHPSAEAAAEALRAEGYALFVASMEGEHTPESLIRPGGRVAVIFGNEFRGVSEELRALADGTFAVPMKGFVESLNVSVAAAITLYTLSRAMCAPLTEGERLALEAQLLLAAVPRGEEVLAEAADKAAIAEDRHAL